MLYVEAQRIYLSSLKYSVHFMEESHVTMLIEHYFISMCGHLLLLNLMLQSNYKWKRQMTIKKTKQNKTQAPLQMHD